MAPIEKRGDEHIAKHQEEDVYGTTSARLLPAGDDPLAYAVYEVPVGSGTPQSIFFDVNTEQSSYYYVVLAKRGQGWEYRGPYQGQETVGGLGSDYVVDGSIRYAVLTDALPGEEAHVLVNATYVTMAQAHP